MPAVLLLSDKCYIGTKTAAGNGEPSAVYTYSETPTRCLVMAQSPAQVEGGTQLPIDAVRIAFHASAAVTSTSRVRVYRRLRKTLSTVEDYVVTGSPKMVRNRLVAVCQRASTRGAN